MEKYLSKRDNIEGKLVFDIFSVRIRNTLVFMRKKWLEVLRNIANGSTQRPELKGENCMSKTKEVKEKVKPETHRSLARCIFARLIHSSPSFEITEHGRMLLMPVLSLPKLKFLLAKEMPNKKTLEKLQSICDLMSLFKDGVIVQEILIQRFQQCMISGEFRTLPFFAPLIETTKVVNIIRGQLVRYELPLIDFLHSMAVLVKNRMEDAGVLERQKDDCIKRAI